MNISQATLDAISTDALLALNRRIVDTIKNRRDRESRALKWTLKSGDNVTYKDRTGDVRRGKISSLATKNALVCETYPSPGKRWRIPMNQLTVIPSTDKPSDIGAYQF